MDQNNPVTEIIVCNLRFLKRNRIDMRNKTDDEKQNMNDKARQKHPYNFGVPDGRIFFKQKLIKFIYFLHFNLN